MVSTYRLFGNSSEQASAHTGVTEVNINTYKFSILVMNKFISVRYEMRPNFAADQERSRETELRGGQ